MKCLSVLFFGYGFGLWGQVGRAPQLALVFAVFGVQMLLSRWWITRYRHGPAEWLWRTLTYSKAAAMRV